MIKVSDKVKHRNRQYYQKCTVIEIEEGCNGNIIVLCEDCPSYVIRNGLALLYGYKEDKARFSREELIKIE